MLPDPPAYPISGAGTASAPQRRPTYSTHRAVFARNKADFLVECGSTRPLFRKCVGDVYTVDDRSALDVQPRRHSWRDRMAKDSDACTSEKR